MLRSETTFPLRYLPLPSPCSLTRSFKHANTQVSSRHGNVLTFQTQNKTSSADQAFTPSTVSPGSKLTKRLAEYLLDPCWDLESSGAAIMSETKESPASDVTPLQNRQRIDYEEDSIEDADLSDDLDFSPPPKSLTKAQHNSADEFISDLHTKHKSSGWFSWHGLHISR